MKQIERIETFNSEEMAEFLNNVRHSRICSFCGDELPDCGCEYCANKSEKQMIKDFLESEVVE